MEDKEIPTPNPAQKQVPRPVKRRRFNQYLNKLAASSVLILLLLLAVGAAVFFYTKYQDSQNKLKHPDVVAKAETQILVDKVSILAQLPKGEQPTVATVSDVSKLSGQTFFANAKNGDKVLIYSKAKEALLYRPSTNKIINLAPLNVNNP